MADTETCPEPVVLADFLLGRLPISDNESCEIHLANCEPCVETIRGLKIDNDTLNDLTRQAWANAAIETDEQAGSESQVVEGIIQRVQSLANVQMGNRTRSLVDEDRAAEVQRLVGPPLDAEEIGVLGDYRLKSLLGAGSTGVVYQAVDSQLDRTVALKVLRPSLGQAARKRFVAEAKAAAAISHPSVVPIYAAGNHGDLAFMAMQWIPGQTLEGLLEQTESLSIEQAQKLGTQIANGLAAAHDCGLIHRDIKPANIWIASETGDATILDFGLVRINDENPQLTCTGMIAGTPCYMSPEQSRGRKLDGRSDLFSLGCLLYQSLVGQLPFSSGNALATLQAIQREQPSPLIEVDPSIPAEVSDLVMMLLEKSPNRRPPSAADVAVALNAPRVDWPFQVMAAETQTVEKLAKPRFRWRAIVAVTTLLVLASFGLFFQPQITRIITNRGEILIETEVEDIQLEVLQNGEHIRVIDLATDQAIEIRAGQYEIRPTGDKNGIEIKNGVLTLTRGGKQVVQITRTETGQDDTIVGALENPWVPSSEANKKPDVVSGTVKFIDTNVDRIELAPGAIQRLRFGKVIYQLSIANPKILNVEPVSGKELVLTAIKPGSSEVFLSLAHNARQKFEVVITPNVYKLASGDVLGVYIEGVLGEAGSVPPVLLPEPGSGLPPAVGFPIPVRDGGWIALPLVEQINVTGLTIPQVEALLKTAYLEGEEPVLNSGRFVVSLMRQRDFEPQNPLFESKNRAYYDIQMELFRLEVERSLASSKLGDDHATMKDLAAQIKIARQTLNELENRQRSEIAGGTGLSGIIPGEDGISEQKPLPVFAGKTYPEWLEIARQERDLSILNPAIQALATLANENQKVEMIDAVIDVARRGANWAVGEEREKFAQFMRSFLRRLEPEDAVKVIVSDLENGTRASHLMLLTSYEYLFKKLEDFEQEERSQVILQILDAVIANADVKDSTEAECALVILSKLRTEKGYPFRENEGLRTFAIRLFENYEPRQFEDKQFVFYEVIPNHEGLVEQSVQYLKQHLYHQELVEWSGGRSKTSEDVRDGVKVPAYEAFEKLPLESRRRVFDGLVEAMRELEGNQWFAATFTQFIQLNYPDIKDRLGKLDEIIESRKGERSIQMLKSTIEEARKSSE